MPSFRIAITADLHWGIRASGDAATRLLVQLLREKPPDLLLLGGDVGAADDFEPCLELFSGLSCAKALVPGNHDVWVKTGDPRGDSLRVFEEHLPAACARQGFHYLDHGPLPLAAQGLAIVGTMNWYDYSWALEDLKKLTPSYDELLRKKRFTRGTHNDLRYVRWPYDDPGFSRLVVERFERHFHQAIAAAPRVLVLTHHPAHLLCNFPGQPDRQSMDHLLWTAYSGNQSLQAFLEEHWEKLALVASGHTHREREESRSGVGCLNIGGDYHYKRLIYFDWPDCTLEAHTLKADEA